MKQFENENCSTVLIKKLIIWIKLVPLSKLLRMKQFENENCSTSSFKKLNNFCETSSLVPLVPLVPYVPNVP